MWKQIGVISVDSGLCWIGDPCYIIHADKLPQELGRSWEEFCDTLPTTSPVIEQFNHDKGYEGRGRVLSRFRQNS